MDTKFGVILEETIHHEGDERSRTNPGHGYPACDETITTFKKIGNEEALKAWIIRNSGQYKPKFTVIKYEDVSFELTTDIKLGN